MMTIRKIFMMWLIGVCLCLLVVIPCRAATALNFSWAANTDNATLGYWLFMDGDTKIATITDKNISEFTYSLENDSEPHDFLLIAYGADEWSIPSVSATWRPPTPIQPKSFIIIPIKVTSDAAVQDLISRLPTE